MTSRPITNEVPISKLVDTSKIEDLNYADISQAGRNFKDLTGKFFGNLFVLGPSARIIRYGEPLWLFYVYCCACGENIVEREAKQLSRSYTKSCGCIRFLYKSKDKKTVVRNMHFKKYLNHARRRNLEVKISETDFYNLFDKECYYCNSKPKIIKSYKKGKHKIVLNGVDRLKNEIGYLHENVVPCCTSCNMTKQAFDSDFFIDHLFKIKRHLKL